MDKLAPGDRVRVVEACSVILRAEGEGRWESLLNVTARVGLRGTYMGITNKDYNYHKVRWDGLSVYSLFLNHHIHRLEKLTVLDLMADD